MVITTGSATKGLSRRWIETSTGTSKGVLMAKPYGSLAEARLRRRSALRTRSRSRVNSLGPALGAVPAR